MPKPAATSQCPRHWNTCAIGLCKNHFSVHAFCWWDMHEQKVAELNLDEFFNLRVPGLCNEYSRGSRCGIYPGFGVWGLAD